MVLLCPQLFHKEAKDASIARALSRIKGDLSNLVSAELIEHSCREAGHHWRQRLLDPVTTIHLFILQILNGNAACGHVPRIAGRTFSASAYAPARKIHPKLHPGDVLVADRGFCSYAHLALILKGRMHACLCIHPKQIVDFRPHRPHAVGKHANGLPRSRWLKRLGIRDQLVEWFKPARPSCWIGEEEFAQRPATLMFALVYNLVRMVMLEAGQRQGVEPDRISFIDALRWLTHTPPDEALPALVVNPNRPGRLEPRAVKRRPKEYDRINKPRAEIRKALLTKETCSLT